MLEELTLDADELKSVPSLSDLPNLRVLNLLNGACKRRQIVGI